MRREGRAGGILVMSLVMLGFVGCVTSGVLLAASTVALENEAVQRGLSRDEALMSAANRMRAELESTAVPPSCSEDSVGESVAVIGGFSTRATYVCQSVYHAAFSVATLAGALAPGDGYSLTGATAGAGSRQDAVFVSDRGTVVDYSADGGLRWSFDSHGYPSAAPVAFVDGAAVRVLIALIGAPCPGAQACVAEVTDASGSPALVCTSAEPASVRSLVLSPQAAMAFAVDAAGSVEVVNASAPGGCGVHTVLEAVGAEGPLVTSESRDGGPDVFVVQQTARSAGLFGYSCTDAACNAVTLLGTAGLGQTGVAGIALSSPNLPAVVAAAMDSPELAFVTIGADGVPALSSRISLPAPPVTGPVFCACAQPVAALGTADGEVSLLSPEAARVAWIRVQGTQSARSQASSLSFAGADGTLLSGDTAGDVLELRAPSSGDLLLTLNSWTFAPAQALTSAPLPGACGAPCYFVATRDGTVSLLAAQGSAPDSRAGDITACVQADGACAGTSIWLRVRTGATGRHVDAGGYD